MPEMGLPAESGRDAPGQGPVLPTVAILAGGLATRMRPATLHTAKSMLTVAGEPFLGHQLRLLVGQGVRHVVLCCGYLEEQLRSLAGDGSRWGCTLEYSPDGAEPLGTGGALRKALPLLGSRFLVMYGDSYLAAPLLPVWRAFGQAGTDGLMTVFRNENLWDTSNVEFADGRLLAYDKQTRSETMRHIDYGLSCLRAEALRAWPGGARFDLAEVAASLLRRRQLAGFEVDQRFYEIGSAAGLAETDALLRGAEQTLRRQA